MEDDVEEDAVLRRDELDVTGAAASEAEELSRVDLRDCAAMLLQVGLRDGCVTMDRQGVARSICVVERNQQFVRNVAGRSVRSC